MARVTVEDCILKIPNRFKLVMIAAQRSRDLSGGLDLTVERDNDKNPVVALREIAEETIDLEDIEAAVIRALQKHVDVDEPGEEGDEFLAVEGALSEFASEAKSSNAPDDPLARALAEAAFSDVEAGADTDAAADETPSEAADAAPSEAADAAPSETADQAPSEDGQEQKEE